MISLYCNDCKQDHGKKLAKWCDRSSIEIENEKLNKLLEIAREALEDFELKNIHMDSCGIRYQGGRGCTCMDLKYYGSYECEQRARQALKEINEVLNA